MRKFLLIILLIGLGISYIAQIELIVDKLNRQEVPIPQEQITKQEKEKSKDKSEKIEYLPGYPAPGIDDYPYPPPRDYSHETPVPTNDYSQLPTPAPTMNPMEG